MLAESTIRSLRELRIDGEADIIARIGAEQGAQRPHARDIVRHTAERCPLRLFDARRPMAIRAVPCHRGEHSAIGIGAVSCGIALRENAPRMIEDAPAPYILLHEGRTHIERMRSERRAVPHGNLDQIEDLDGDEDEEAGCRRGDMAAHFSIRHDAASLRGAESAVRIPRKTKLAAIELPP